jgi:hypothetical protein
MESPKRWARRSSSDIDWKLRMLLLSLERLGQWKARAVSVVRYWDVNKYGENGLNPSTPASWNGLALIGRWIWPYLVSDPSAGWNGINSIGYGDKSEACYLSLRLWLEQCTSS